MAGISHDTVGRGFIKAIMYSCALIMCVLWPESLPGQEEERSLSHDLEFFFFETKSFPGIVSLFQNHSAVSSFGYTMHVRDHGIRTKLSWYNKMDEDFDFYRFHNKQLKLQAGYQYRFPFKAFRWYPFLDVLIDWSSSEHLRFIDQGGGQVLTAVSNRGFGSEAGVGLEYQIGDYIILGIETTTEFIFYRNTTEETHFSNGNPNVTTSSRQTGFLRFNPVKAFSLGIRL